MDFKKGQLMMMKMMMMRKKKMKKMIKKMKMEMMVEKMIAICDFGSDFPVCVFLIVVVVVFVCATFMALAMLINKFTDFIPFRE